MQSKSTVASQSLVQNPQQKVKNDQRSKEIAKDFGFWSQLKKFRIISCVVCNAVSLTCLTFKEPVLAIKLN
jgi:hypothetical protein